MAAEARWPEDPPDATALYEVTDRAIHAALARYTMNLSPRALSAAYLDWVSGLMFSPGKAAQLGEKALRKTIRYNGYLASSLLQGGAAEPCIEPLPQDKRFRSPAWRQPPYAALYQAFLLTQQWWHNATTGVDGVTPQHERAVEFAARQILDTVSPSNFILTNPDVAARTVEENGRNLLRGARNFLEDWRRAAAGQGPAGAEAFEVGVHVATTKGKVVYKNDLIELIQYAPTTRTVYAEPVLIVPAWIMKYYILDLSPENSLVKYLVERGHTVFMISWKNPLPPDRDLGLEDYRKLGVEAALSVIAEQAPGAPVHGVGYCLGGTLLAIAAAAAARRPADADKPVFRSLTFLATQVDFEEAGDLMLFINEKQIAFLEDVMWEQGYLDAHQMAGAFQMLRSNDLIWSKALHDYLLGERRPMSDLMAWNADATRMPYKMHSEYLRKLFLNNDLAEGRYRVDGRPIALTDITAPIFVVATEKDHVAPWRSVYKFHLLTDAEVTFLLTSGGHNAGIVSEPGHPNRHFAVATQRPDDPHIGPDAWVDQTPPQEGSWWPEWEGWLRGHSAQKRIPARDPAAGPKGARLRDAPGVYVFGR